MFNNLSSSEVTAQDQLFSTLDPTTRKINLASTGELLLSDTVGFIQKLSPFVVAAFNATLQELAHADILLHVVDITHRKAEHQVEVVLNTLKKLELSDKPMILVLNKVDKAENLDELLNLGQNLTTKHSSPHIFISATTGQNLNSLLELVEQEILDRDGKIN